MTDTPRPLSPLAADMLARFRKMDVMEALPLFHEMEKMLRGRPEAGSEDAPAEPRDEREEDLERIERIKGFFDGDVVSIEVIPLGFAQACFRAAERINVYSFLDRNDASFLRHAGLRALAALEKSREEIWDDLIEIEDVLEGVEDRAAARAERAARRADFARRDAESEAA